MWMFNINSKTWNLNLLILIIMQSIIIVEVDITNDYSDKKVLKYSQREVFLYKYNSEPGFFFFFSQEIVSYF